MEKKLVSNYYNRKFDESQKVVYDFENSIIMIGGKRYVDITRTILEAESYHIANMTPEEVKLEEIGMLL